MHVAFIDPLEARLAEFPERYLGEHEVMLTETAGRAPEGELPSSPSPAGSFDEVAGLKPRPLSATPSAASMAARTR